MYLPTLGPLGPPTRASCPLVSPRRVSSLQSLSPTYVLFDPQPWEAGKILMGQLSHHVSLDPVHFVYIPGTSFMTEERCASIEGESPRGGRKYFLSIGLLPPSSSFFIFRSALRERCTAQSQTGLIPCLFSLALNSLTLAGYLLSLGLSVLICKMGIMTVSTSGGIVRFHWDQKWIKSTEELPWKVGSNILSIS